MKTCYKCNVDVKIAKCKKENIELDCLGALNVKRSTLLLLN
jgi:hypothetical protein